MNEPRRRPGRRPQRDARRLVKEGLLPQADLFERIFEWDATIVDIDLSIWDKQIAIYVRPHHGGLYFVEFLRVRSLNIEFNHHEFDFNEKFGPDEHIHWVINRFDVQQVEHGLAISFWGSPQFPRLQLVCENVFIREMSMEVPDRLFPDWRKPRSGLIRPGLAALSRRGLH